MILFLRSFTDDCYSDDFSLFDYHDFFFFLLLFHCFVFSHTKCFVVDFSKFKKKIIKLNLFFLTQCESNKIKLCVFFFCQIFCFRIQQLYELACSKPLFFHFFFAVGQFSVMVFTTPRRYNIPIHSQNNTVFMYVFVVKKYDIMYIELYSLLRKQWNQQMLLYMC